MVCFKQNPITLRPLLLNIKMSKKSVFNHTVPIPRGNEIVELKVRVLLQDVWPADWKFLSSEPSWTYVEPSSWLHVKSVLLYTTSTHFNSALDNLKTKEEPGNNTKQSKLHNQKIGIFQLWRTRSNEFCPQDRHTVI